MFFSIADLIENTKGLYEIESVATIAKIKGDHPCKSDVQFD
jgi:hypothetical protein